MGGSQSNACTITKHVDEKLHHKIVECKCHWTLTNFPDTTFTVGRCITSRTLRVDIEGSTDEWEIDVYPGGYNERTADFLSVWLRRVSTRERLVEFTCEISNTQTSFIEDDNLIVFARKTLKKKLSLESFLGWSAFCERSRILAEDSGALEEGNLTLKFTLRIFDDKCIPHPAVEDEDPNMDETLQELSEDFNQLFHRKKHCDVTIKVNGELIRAHKAILCTRSAVFQKMFEFESMAGFKKIVIDDISKDTLLVMMQFMYTGKLPTLSFDSTMELYYAADKYELASLKRLCSRTLANSLNNKNSVQVLALAHRHHDSLLQKTVVDFIAKNAAMIQSRPDWLELMKSSPALANIVFQRLAQINVETKPFSSILRRSSRKLKFSQVSADEVFKNLKHQSFNDKHK